MRMLVTPDPSGSLVFGYRVGRQRPRALQSPDVSAVLHDLKFTDSAGRPIVAHGFRSTFAEWVGDHYDEKNRCNRSCFGAPAGARPQPDRTDATTCSKLGVRSCSTGRTTFSRGIGPDVRSCSLVLRLVLPIGSEVGPTICPDTRVSQGVPGLTSDFLSPFVSVV